MASWWQGVAGLGARRQVHFPRKPSASPANCQPMPSTSALAALSLGWGLPVF